MRLDQALVQRGLCESREEAQECIEGGSVFLNGTVITKKTRQVDETMILMVTNRRKYVSRGGDKLEGILHEIYGNDEQVKKALSNRSAIDVGSSTGGFTDCLISYGVSTVTAVDVGTLQLHPRLREDTRVLLFENTDIRNFSTDTQFDTIVADLSFITLEKVIDTVLQFGHTNSNYFLLIKPQFEVGKGNTKKGIVKDKQLVEDVLKKYQDLITSKGYPQVQIFPCKIAGGGGNQEYFLYIH